MIRTARGSGQDLRPRNKKVLTWVFREGLRFGVPGLLTPHYGPTPVGPARSLQTLSQLAWQRGGEPSSPLGSQTQHMILSSQGLLGETLSTLNSLLF